MAVQHPAATGNLFVEIPRSPPSYDGEEGGAAAGTLFSDVVRYRVDVTHTGNGNKLSCSQAQLGQATYGCCLVSLRFLCEIHSIHSVLVYDIDVRFHNISLYTVETDRNPNVDYRQKPNILLNPKYSANCRIPEYYAPTACGQLFGFGRIFG